MSSGPGPTALPRSERRSVALVDGDQELTDLLEEVLTAEGFRVLRTAPAELAPSALADDGTALVILDTDPTADPSQGTSAVLRTLRDDPVTGTIPILVTAADLRLLREQAPEVDELEGVTLLVKPFSVDDLLGAMSAAMESPAGRSSAGPG